ncbi:putative anion transporter 3, chloroplastic [Asimina triloba]
MAGFNLGNAIGLLLSTIIMARAGVFGPFVIFGLCGFLWVLVWVSATSSAPDRHPQISKFELDYILDGRQKPSGPPSSKKGRKTRVIPPFRHLLSKLPTWALISANGMHSWMYRVDLRQAAWFSAIPWVMMAALGYAAGVLSDMLIRRGSSVTFTRKVVQVTQIIALSIGFVGPGLALLGLNSAKSPSVASAWLTAAVGLSSFSNAGFLVNLQEIAPQYAGVIHGEVH